MTYHVATINTFITHRLKAAMHGASMGEEWTGNNRAEEEAGISRLDGMATSEERLQTLNAVRLVSEVV